MFRTPYWLAFLFRRVSALFFLSSVIKINHEETFNRFVLDANLSPPYQTKFYRETERILFVWGLKKTQQLRTCFIHGVNIDRISTFLSFFNLITRNLTNTSYTRFLHITGCAYRRSESLMHQSYDMICSNRQINHWRSIHDNIGISITCSDFAEQFIDDSLNDSHWSFKQIFNKKNIWRFEKKISMKNFIFRWK